MADEHGFEDEGTLVLEQRFAIVPEWVIDAPVSDCAFRLYAVLLRYGQTSGQRMPGRTLLAKRLHKGSKDTVDRALKELVSLGAVVVERRRAGRQNLTNRYHLRTTSPGAAAPSPDAAAAAPGRRSAATPGGRNGAATPGRSNQVRVAAAVRPNPGVPTEKKPPPAPPTPTPARPADAAPPANAATPPDAQRALLQRCGITDLHSLAARCQQLRRELGQPPARWAAGRLAAALHEAVVVKGWPAPLAGAALLTVAADPRTNSPMRLACPGPWWDIARTERPALTPGEAGELAALEARLLEADGRRVWLQQHARAELAERGQTLTRLGVARRACQLLDEAELSPC